MTKHPFIKDNYKFRAESFLSMFLNQYQFVLGADLEHYSQNDEPFNEENPCNIYFVLQSPKITIDPNSFSSNGKTAVFNFIIHDREKKEPLAIKITLPEAISDLKLITEYPYNIFAIADNTKTLLVARPSSLLDSVNSKGNAYPELLDYEILYIGQAYGKNGERTALNRLASHETVQRIYTHALTNNPECDIWIMLTNFSQVSMLLSGGTNKDTYDIISEKRDRKIAQHFFANEGLTFTEKQKINFTEAALIRLFEPRYNKEFKTTFPNNKHSSYSECYSLDVRALLIELDTSEMPRKIFTEKSGRKIYHSKMFEFKNDADRISLLNVYNSSDHIDLSRKKS